MNPELKGLPKLRTVDQYNKEKFEATILNTIINRMQDRVTSNLASQNASVREFVSEKIKKIQNHFENNINVIDADRKEQRQRIEALKAMKTLEKSRSIAATAS